MPLMRSDMSDRPVTNAPAPEKAAPGCRVYSKARWRAGAPSAQRPARGVGLRRQRQVDRGLGQRVRALRHPDVLDRLGGGGRLGTRCYLAGAGSGHGSRLLGGAGRLGLWQWEAPTALRGPICDRPQAP